MKLRRFSWLAALLLFSGCGNNGDGSNQTTNTAVGPPPVGDNYGSALANAENRAVDVVDTTSLKQAIQLFNVQEGRFPKDLNELVGSKLIGQIPPAPRGKKLDYNPDTGEIKVVNQ
jgi:hypothetical protein